MKSSKTRQCGMGEFALTYGIAAMIITAIVIWVCTHHG